MDKDNLKIVKQYVMRRIAEKNIVLSRILYSHKESSKILRYCINRNFAAGTVSMYDSVESNINLNAIYDDIRNQEKPLAPYNYFDLDTLIAYDKYLESIIDNIYNNRTKGHRNYFVMEDFQKAIDIDTPNLFKNTTDRKLVGYYNLTCPLQTIKDKHGNLTCERTPAKATFSKHHSVLECNNLLKQYLEERHPDLSKKTDDGFETFEFEGREFNIISSDNYFDEHMHPIKYIVADSQSGNTRLMGFFDMNMRVYHGDLFDLDGELVYDKTQSGCSIYGESATNHFDGMGR